MQKFPQTFTRNITQLCQRSISYRGDHYLHPFIIGKFMPTTKLRAFEPTILLDPHSVKNRIVFKFEYQLKIAVSDIPDRLTRTTKGYTTFYYFYKDPEDAVQDYIALKDIGRSIVKFDREILEFYEPFSNKHKLHRLLGQQQD